MACIFEALIENLATGERVGVTVGKDFQWGVNVALEDGRLLALPPGTVVITGYGFGNR